MNTGGLFFCERPGVGKKSDQREGGGSGAEGPEKAPSLRARSLTRSPARLLARSFDRLLTHGGLERGLLAMYPGDNPVVHGAPANKVLDQHPLRLLPNPERTRPTTRESRPPS